MKYLRWRFVRIFWHYWWQDVRSSFGYAYGYVRVRYSEEHQKERWLRWSKAQSLGSLERRASEQRIDKKLAELDRKEPMK